MPESHELDQQECERLLRGGVVGRVALSTPGGPHIIPVNYAVIDDSIVLRTSSYSLLGTHGRDAMLAFEIDHIDHDRHVGWSVVARGRSWAETDPQTLARIREGWQPHPWASGNRNLYLRIRWESLEGRSLGRDWTRENEYPVHRTVSAL
jgi:nitroimidazol reductase NimA-like FMN-containing flavoprotein (pyridoxamine 5'-phosphate oxidase superfamily)